MRPCARNFVVTAILAVTELSVKFMMPQPICRCVHDKIVAKHLKLHAETAQRSYDIIAADVAGESKRPFRCAQTCVPSFERLLPCPCRKYDGKVQE